VTAIDRSFFVGPSAEPDKYRLEAQISSGGEAELWLAAVAVAGQWEPVAVKVLRTDLMGDVELWRARWAEQAELLRFVRHPAVVGVREHFDGPPIHLAGEADSDAVRGLFLVMNWVEGRDLRSWVPLHRNPEGILEGIRYLQQVASVLDWLHTGHATPSGREVIHGDVSPANVVVTPAGQAVLVDFGLLRVAAQTSPSVEGTYIAPEVRHLGQYSPAADRFSFGGLAYFVLTGTRPPTEPAALRSGLGQVGMVAGEAGLVDELMAIFNEDPDARPTAGEWVRRLRQSSSTVVGSIGLPPPAPGTVIPLPGGVQPRRQRRRRVLLGAALTVIASLAIAYGGAVLASGTGGGPRLEAADSKTSGVDHANTAATTAPPTVVSIAPTSAPSPSSTITTPPGASTTSPTTAILASPTPATTGNAAAPLPHTSTLALPAPGTVPPIPLTITQQPAAAATALLRTTVTLHVDVSGGKSPLNFSWFEDGTPIPGTSSSLVAGPFNLRNSGLYTTTFSVRVSDQAGQQLTSSSSVVKVVGNPDINGDGSVNCADLAILRAAYGSTAGTTTWNPVADLNGDGAVNITDLSIQAADWTGPTGGTNTCP
jgi:serine/threonine protein kinase